MNNQQIETLILKGHKPADIANYGQCSHLQVDRVYLKLIIKQSPNTQKAITAQWALDNMSSNS